MQDFLLRVRNLARLVTVNEVTYCRSPEPISGASCPAQIEQGGGEITREGTTREGTTREGTTRETNTRANNDVESLLVVQVVAEVYVQPAAGGGEATAAAPPPPAPAGGGAAKGKAGAKGGGAAK